MQTEENDRAIASEDLTLTIAEIDEKLNRVLDKLATLDKLAEILEAFESSPMAKMLGAKLAKKAGPDPVTKFGG